MTQHLRTKPKRNRMARRGRPPRVVTIEAVPAPGLHPDAVRSFRRSLTAFRADLAQRLIDQGVAYIDDQGVLRVRKP